MIAFLPSMAVNLSCLPCLSSLFFFLSLVMCTCGYRFLPLLFHWLLQTEIINSVFFLSLREACGAYSTPPCHACKHTFLFSFLYQNRSGTVMDAWSEFTCSLPWVFGHSKCQVSGLQNWALHDKFKLDSVWAALDFLLGWVFGLGWGWSWFEFRLKLA